MNIKQTTVKTDKIYDDLNIGIITDTHFSTSTQKHKYNGLLNEIEKLSFDYLLLLGDHIHDENYVDEHIPIFYKNITNLTERVIAIYGNHDEMIYNHKTGQYEQVNSTYLSEIFFKNGIKELKNNNVYFEDHNVNLIGLYFKPYLHYEELRESREHFIAEVNNNFKEPFNSDYYNILLSHSPVNAMNEEVYNKIILYKTIDLVLSGHMHNGVVPYWSEKYLDFILKNIKNGKYLNYGLTDPYLKKFIVPNTRGYKQVDEIDFIINAPTTGVTELHKLQKLINSKLILPTTINQLKLERTKEKVLLN